MSTPSSPPPPTTTSSSSPAPAGSTRRRAIKFLKPAARPRAPTIVQHLPVRAGRKSDRHDPRPGIMTRTAISSWSRRTAPSSASEKSAFRNIRGRGPAGPDPGRGGRAHHRAGDRRPGEYFDRHPRRAWPSASGRATCVPWAGRPWACAASSSGRGDYVIGAGPGEAGHHASGHHRERLRQAHPHRGVHPLRRGRRSTGAASVSGATRSPKRPARPPG